MFTKTITQVLLVMAMVLLASTAMAEKTMTEDALVDRVENALRHYDDISVKMDKGTLVVKGDVATEAERKRILDTVKQQSGATPIRDDLRVDSKRKEREIDRTNSDYTNPKGNSQSVGEYADDAGITAAVKSKLLVTKEVSSFDIQVDTHDGVVTLTGIADSKAHVEQAGRVAKSVDGVKSVDNRIIVKP